MQRLASLHFVEESELVLEFRIELRIGNIAAGRNVEIMQAPAALTVCGLVGRTPTGDVARIDLVAEGADIGGLERQLRDHRDAVIALLPVQGDVLHSRDAENVSTEKRHQCIWFPAGTARPPRRFEKFGDEIDGRRTGIDVPCRYGEAQ